MEDKAPNSFSSGASWIDIMMSLSKPLEVSDYVYRMSPRMEIALKKDNMADLARREQYMELFL